jgi:hypothetical protein
MRTVQVVLCTRRRHMYVCLGTGRHVIPFLSWGRLPVVKRTNWEGPLWVKREGSFALNLKGRVLIRVRYG